MKKIIALHLSLILLFTSIQGAFAATPPSNCENGECAQEMIRKLESLNSLFQSTCLPKKGMTDTEIKSHFEKYGVTEACWKMITEIKHLEDQLQGVKSQLEARLGCEGGLCKDPNSGQESLNSQLLEMQKVEKKLSCTEEKKSAVKSSCGNDLKCTVYASVLGIGGYLAEKMITDESKIKGCNLGDDGCAVQLVTGLLKSIVTFFEGAWDLLKAGGKYAGKKAGEFWDWVTAADDHASTSQLSLAEASTDEGVLDMLMKDFPGTMNNIIQGLIAALKEWMKNDVFCQKWEGVPHFGKCLEPSTDYDCVSCKTMVTGVCSMVGTIVAEVVPAFLTGGLASAAKYGVNGASKIAKVFKVSDKAMDAFKASKVAKYTMEAATKVDDVLKVSKGLKLAKEAVELALSGIGKYLLSPARLLAKSSISAIAELSKKGSLYLVQTKFGKSIIFTGKVASTAGKVILYPIDNPMTTWAFKAGERTFEKALKIGSPKLVTSSKVIQTAIKSDQAIEDVLIKLERSQLSSNPQASKILELEEELLSKVLPKRQSMASELLASDQAKFEELIATLYPELKYGGLASKLGPDAVLKAEQELLDLISKLPEGAQKNELMRKFELLVADGEARRKIVGKSRVGGKKQPEDDFENLKDVEVPQVNPQIYEDMAKDKSYSVILDSVDEARKKTTARSLKLLQDSGMRPEEVAAVYKRHEKYFEYVSKNSPADSDAASMLAEYIKRQKKAGIADDVLDKKLADAFKGCK